MTSDEFTDYFKKNYRGTSSFLSGFMLMCVDAFSLLLCICLAFFIVNFISPPLINFRSFINYSVYIPLILLVYYAAGLYPGIMLSPSEEVRKLCICSFFCFIGISTSILVEGNHGMYLYITRRIVKDSENIAVGSALMLSVPFTALLMPAARDIARHLFGKRAWWGVPAVIYCTGISGNEVINRLILRPDLGYKPAVIINSNCSEYAEYNGIPVFPVNQEILEKIKQLNIKVAIMCDYEGSRRPVMTSFRYTINVSKNQDIFTNTIQLKDIGGIIGFSSTHNLTKGANLFIKRIIDLFIILFAAILALPLTVLISIIIKCTSPGPVFYGHKRVGKNGRQIKCWKFRSMYSNADKMLEKILAENPEMRAEWEQDRKFVNDPRVTKFGKFLRKTSLDELPQLWNILCGEMSIVGPRPVTQEELEKYGSNADYILSVTPGLSGMWQISGRSDTGYEERINLDTYYIQNWSVWLDLWIIMKTVWVVIKGKGAY